MQIGMCVCKHACVTVCMFCVFVRAFRVHESVMTCACMFNVLRRRYTNSSSPHFVLQ